MVKGGHLAGDDAPDVVVADGELHTFAAERVLTTNDHGTGCTLSAAIAALLASGQPPLAAIAQAKEFVSRALAGSARWRLGAGQGPSTISAGVTGVLGERARPPRGVAGRRAPRSPAAPPVAPTRGGHAPPDHGAGRFAKLGGSPHGACWDPGAGPP